MDATTRFNTMRVGALPVVVAYLEKMRLAEVIDAHVPWEGEVSLGTLVEIMVCNRMLNPRAQYKIGEWAARAGVCDYYQVSAEQLNDDRLGRALERIAKHAFTVQSQLILHLVKEFKLNVSNIHYDISNVELYGAYERQLKENAQTQDELANTKKNANSVQNETEQRGAQGPKPMYGRTKSGRKNVKQVQFGINVARDGAVPIDLLPFDGNEAEVKTHIENLDRLRRMLPTKSLVYTADTKFDSPENLLVNNAAGGQFLCGGVWAVRQIAVCRKIVVGDFEGFCSIVALLMLMSARPNSGRGSMETVVLGELKSPLKKLVEFFRGSRDKWKAKYFRKRDEGILLANKVRAIEKSRDHWRAVAQSAQQLAKQAKADLHEFREELKKSAG